MLVAYLPRFVDRKLSVRAALALLCCVVLIVPVGPLLSSSEAALEAVKTRMDQPRPGAPEGKMPNLEDVKRWPARVRESRPAMPSTIRSPKNAERPWDGRRVGDPLPAIGSTAGPVEQTQRSKANHARATRVRADALAPVTDEAFMQNFFYWALGRYASGYEPPYWNDQLRVGYGQGQESLRLAAIELGKTLFESAEYAARNRDNHWYVYDLYKTYLMRDPDPGGWAFWESCIPGSGRENVRRGFEDSGEFQSLIATITPNGSPSSSPSSLITARVDPTNQPNNGMIVRDAAWSLPLLILPGRADLDLGLSLSYSSMVWTRSGPYIYFDEDTGFPSPGFRLGFPTMQRRVFDAQTARNAFLLLTPAGRRVELRQVGTSNIYEAADSSYLQLTDNGSTKLLRTTDGTQLTFSEFNNELRCSQVKDRNGNYITVSYDGWGHITTIVDTLGRNITFNYDGNANLLSITQNWNGTNHQWVSFGWTTRTMQSSFTGVSTVGPPNGTVLPVISQVNIDDGSYYQFDYTNSLQVLSITRKSFDNVQRSQTTFTYETPTSDVPRLSDSRLTASNWTGINGVPAQVIMQYSVAGDGACVLTTPDGTVYKDYYGTGWQKGLSTLREVWVGGVRQKWTTTSWTQDNTAVSYQINPRTTEMNVYDSSGNRRRTTIDYYPTSSFSLPSDVYEYAADATTVLRRHHRDYNLNPVYTDRRLIGLLFAEYLYDGTGGLQSKVMYHRDWGAPWLVDQGATIQHDDANYGSGFIVGRGNVHLIERYDVEYPNDPARIISTKTGYNTAGSVTFTADGLWHRTDYAYTDAFSDSINRNTLAYPTTITDHDGFSSTVQYNFDFGVITRTQSPPPAGQTQGLIQTMLYNAAGQLERVTTVNSGAYRRFWYGPDYVASYASVNNVADESYAIQTFDGLGRVIGEASNHPGSSGGYKALNTIYDQMGRVFKASNPAEITGSWVPTGDDAAGWLYMQQTYDWQGRPLVTTNTDGTTREVSYSGCGCAGGEVATLTDEGTIDAGIAKRRQKKIYADVLGRTVKTELLNWQGGSVYSASVNTYNARDQVTQIRQYAGVEGSGSFQDTTITHDGYGRVKTKHVPEQTGGASTVLNYNADDTISTVTDARGALTTYGYNGRHLLTSLSYSAPGGITVPAPVSFTYDAADNRSSMVDGSGSTTYQYDQLSRITSEAHNINGLAGTQSIGYTYTLTGQLSTLTDPQGRTVSYAYDSGGMLSSVTGSGYTNASQFANNFQYRAWGAAKHFNIGFDWWNGTSSLTPADLWYDNRMRLSHFKLNHPNTAAGPIYDSTYQYYADGKPKFISDVRAWSIQEGWPPTENMHHFDRGYRYDHLGRLTAGLTGDEARGGTNPDGPYKESYQYDVWHNMNQRANRIWSKPVDNISYTYVNNRKQGVPWQYDADGNETSEATFDAAGRKAGFFTYLFLGLGSEGQFHWYSANAEATYDGNGQLVKEQDSIGPTTYMTVFYVRSAVLGGEPVMMVKDEPYNGTGTVTRTASIYGNGARIGFSTEGYVRFEHSEPLTGRRTSVSEVDPLGQEVGSYDPGPEESGDVGNYPEPHEFGNAEDPGMGCTLDGISIDCGTATRLLNTGTVGLAGPNNKVVNDSNGKRILARNEPTFGEVLLGHFWEWVDDSGKKPTGQPKDDPDSDVIQINGWIPRGHWGEVFQLGRQAQGQGRKGRTNRRGRKPPKKQQPAAPPPPSACARFAEELANRLYNTVVLAGGFNPDSRHDLANEMNRRGRNNVDFNGRAYGKTTYPIDGFRPALTANGQLADVYRHILFTAGNSLHGTAAADAENAVFRAYDWQQSARGRAESDTELADDDAGMAVGELMLNTALAGRSGNYAQLMADIRNILCAF